MEPGMAFINMSSRKAHLPADRIVGRGQGLDQYLARCHKFEMTLLDPKPRYDTSSDDVLLT